MSERPPPRVALIHALRHSIAPITAAFERDWPAAQRMNLLDDSLSARRNLLTWIQSGGLVLTEPEGADFQRIGDLMEKYADLPMDFADAVLVALCERLAVTHIASVDRDFAIYRYQGRARFTNVFLS